MLFLVRKYLINSAGEVNILFVLLLCGGGIALAYLIDFFWRNLKNKKDTNQ